MPDDQFDQPRYEVGAIANGHVLTAAGWVPLRQLPINARPPYRAGDVYQGSAFTGVDWVRLPDPDPRPTTNRSTTASSSKRTWLPRSIGIVVVAVALGAMALVNQPQSDAMRPEPRADAERTSAAPTPAKPSSAETSKPTETPQTDPSRVVMDGMWVHDNIDCQFNGYTSTVTGTLTNQSGSPKNYVQISFGLYDASDALLGTAYGNVTNLASGTDWKYKAVGTVGEFATCKVDEVTAY